MSFEKLKQDANDFKGKLSIPAIQKQLENVFGQMNEQTRKLADEVLRIHKPKAKKTIEINGKNCEISLIEDGRIMIQFPDINSSENYYNEPPVISEKEHLDERNKWYHNGKIDGMEWHNLDWKHANFIKRMLNMVKLPERTRI